MYICPTINQHKSMKKILLASVAILVFACSSDDTVTTTPVEENPENPLPENPETPEECLNVYTGNVLLKSQAEVDAFAANNYCKVDGVLIIGAPDDDPSTDITDLSDLSGLVSVSKWVYITNNSNLVSLNGLQNIKDLLEIRIGSPALTNLEGCPDIVEGGTVTLVGNISLQGLELKNYMILQLMGDIDLRYFEQYTNVEILSELTIIQNKATRLTGLENIKKIGELGIKYNPNLISLEGLENVTTLENIEIWENPELVSLEHLNGVTAIKTIPEITNLNIFPGFDIAGNAKLETLQGLENIVYYGGTMIKIAANYQLTDYCALTPLLQYDSDMQWNVFSNEYNPTIQNIINGNCSQ